MHEYPYVDVRGNNRVIIPIAGVTAFISLVMVIVTVVLVIRRDKR